MTIQLNGEEHETKALKIDALLEELGYSGQPVLVEWNGAALFPREFESTQVAHGDQIELIRVVAGG